MIIKIMGYDSDTEDWVEIKVDSNGRIVVTFD